MSKITDQEFDAIISKIAANRRAYRKKIWDITAFFDPITGKYTLMEFRDYLAGRLKMSRENASNKEWTGVKNDELRTMNKRFYKLDRISITFKYNSDWSEIENFKAGLQDCDEWGGVIGRIILFILIFPSFVMFSLKKTIKNIFKKITS
jgi:hypothetical protein